MSVFSLFLRQTEGSTASHEINLFLFSLLSAFGAPQMRRPLLYNCEVIFPFDLKDQLLHCVGRLRSNIPRPFFPSFPQKIEMVLYYFYKYGQTDGRTTTPILDRIMDRSTISQYSFFFSLLLLLFYFFYDYPDFLNILVAYTVCFCT